MNRRLPTRIGIIVAGCERFRTLRSNRSFDFAFCQLGPGCNPKPFTESLGYATLRTWMITFKATLFLHLTDLPRMRRVISKGETLFEVILFLVATMQQFCLSRMPN